MPFNPLCSQGLSDFGGVLAAVVCAVESPVLFVITVPAGFPSPAEDYLEGNLDLNQYLIRHPAATFFVRVSGDSMVGAGIFPNDLLIVDRAVNPTHGSIVVAALEGDLTVKRYCQQAGCITLCSENSAYPPIVLEGDRDCVIWGVVTQAIHHLVA